MVKIAQINICGLSDRSKLCLDKYIDEQKADLIFLSETKSDHNNHSFANCVYTGRANKSNPNQKGGVGIISHNSLTIDRQSHLEKDSIDAIFATITIGHTRLLCCSVYIGPNAFQDLKTFLGMTEQAYSQLDKIKCSGMMIIGDLNSRHSSWGDTTDNKFGKFVSDFVDNKNLTIISKYEGNSFLCDQGGSRIDLCMVSNSILKNFVDQYADITVELFTGAPHRGHLPIWTILDFSHVRYISRRTYCWQDTNWAYFENTLDQLSIELIPKTVNMKDPSVLWHTAKTLLLEAKERCVPQKHITGHSKLYWNPELSRLSYDLRKARKLFKFRSNFENGDALKLAKDRFTQEITKAKNSYLDSVCSNLNDSNGQLFWKHFNRTFYPKSDISKNIGSLKNELGEVLSEDSCKAHLFYKDIFLGQHLSNSPFDDNWKTIVENYVGKSDFLDDTKDELNIPIMVDEIVSVQTKLKTSGKSIDNDGIHPQMLKYCGQQFLILLYKLFNAAFANNKWPWDEGKVIFLRKPGKPDYSSTSAYRPITITSYVGKWFEHILKNRLTTLLVNKNVISDSQHGFRKNYSTSTYMFQLLASIQSNLKKENKIAGIFIDLQKAFDSVWHDGLLYKLYHAGVKGRMLKLIACFIKSRRVSLQVNDYSLEPKTCKIGVPQGSVLSPILFNLYINDMLEGITGTALQYADDLSIIVTGVTDQHLQQSSQQHCNTISDWLKKWRFVANCSKTDFIIFQGICATPTLSGEQINKTTTSKVLGITVDSKLEFKQQINSSLKSLNNKWALLKPFIFKNLSIITTRKILSSVIIPKICYLGFLWDKKNCISLYRALKDMLRVPYRPPGEHLHVFARIKPISLLYESQRLTLMRQLIINKSALTLVQYDKSLVYITLNASSRKFLGVRQLNSVDLKSSNFKKSTINKYITKKWKETYNNYSKFSGTSYGLLLYVQDKATLIDSNPIPIQAAPRLVGNLCALLTGHTRLQLHTYRLGLTYSPTCVCLSEDETSQHYVFECELYKHVRNKTSPSVNDWYSIIDYIKATERNP